MQSFAKLASTALLGAAIALGASTAFAAEPAAHPKNWTPPATKIYAQTLADEIMAKHHDLISVTFHGVPPGMTDTYTMFAGSYPDRIGNSDDPDDIDISKKGITVIDPRWHKTTDTVKKFCVMLPLHDASGENVGELVLAYKHPADSKRTEQQFFLDATALRNRLAKQIPTYDALFQPAK